MHQFFLQRMIFSIESVKDSRNVPVVWTGLTRVPSSFDAVMIGEGKPRSQVPCLGTLRQLRDDSGVVTDFSMQGLGVAYRGFLAKVLFLSARAQPA